MKARIKSKVKLLAATAPHISKIYFVYILECQNGSLYTGITTDVRRRFKEHKKGNGGHYTRSQKVVRVVFSEEHLDRSHALKREAQIKSWSREKKIQFVKIEAGS